MKKNVMRMLTLVLAVVLLAGLVSGCGKDSGNNSTTGGAAVNTGAATQPAGTTGTEEKVKVSILVPSDFESHIRQALEVFSESHPNIDVELIIGAEEASKMPSELSTLAAGNKLPDVAIGVENFAYILSQGLAYPLDNLYAADPDKEDALQAGINNYTYNGHLYALPFRVQFNGIMVNMDLIETKNLDEPDYDWTIEEFIDMAKKATDNQYSGINIVESGDSTHTLQTKLMGAMMNAPYNMYGYNMETHEFDFTSGAWTKSQEYITELRSVPGLISDELKEWDKRNKGIPDAYDNKFGGSADAMVAGKVLFGNHNSWETYWMVKKCNFEWDLYPVPHAEDVAERIQTHVDYAFLTPAVTEQNAQAAYEVIKFLSYSKEGCLTRLAITDEGVSANDYTAFYTPGSSNPDVLEAYFDNDLIPEGMKYMLETISEDPEKIFIADANKLIPNFWNDVDDYLSQTEEQIKNGGDAHALAQDLQNKVNAAAKDTWERFEKKLEKNLEEFYKTHPYEKK